MNKILLALLLSTSLLMSCDNDDNTTDGNRPLTTVAGGATCKGVVCPNGGSCHLEQDKAICVDACASVRCAYGPCVVTDGKAVCTDQRADAGNTATCKGVVCPNGGSCHLEQDKPICIDACAAVRCAYGPCVVKDGRPVCTDQRADAGTGPSDCRTDGCEGTDSCQPCKTTTGAAYVCLPRGTVC